ncbi:DUF3173 domain-containing protein [Limosilactobacillus agrestimuris]|uniref:DUF3173 domain-containing protein n=1 Tax=Limosilactobacillus agrestimuris TaxID=2941331 RepID=UPI00203FA4CD|nr:DUF3173 domain-containing protein [Limosilactobacillus agrestimuris]
MAKQTANYKDLMAVGFKEHQAREIIHQAKINLVNDGLALYNGKRIGVVPAYAVEKIIGFPLFGGTDNNG